MWESPAAFLLGKDLRKGLIDSFRVSVSETRAMAALELAGSPEVHQSQADPVV